MNKIRVGFFSVSEIEGDPEEYVEWHQLDHMPEQFRIPGLSWGQRFFATPGCVASSAYREGPMGSAGHVQNYLFERFEPVSTEFTALGHALSGLGRMRRVSVAHVQAPFQLVAEFASPRAFIASDAVPYRPNTGIYLLVERVGDAAAVADWRRHEHVERMPTILGLPGVVGAWVYAAPKLADDGTGPYGMPASTKQITVVYLDDDPIATSAALVPVLERRWAGAPVSPLLAGAFRSYFPPPARFCRIDDPAY